MIPLSLRIRPSLYAVRPDVPVLADGLRTSVPALLYGIRLWVAVCLALLIAFLLQLDNPYRAGATAAGRSASPSSGRRCARDGSG